jgi:hypothetical protein
VEQGLAMLHQTWVMVVVALGVYWPHLTKQSRQEFYLL